MSNIRHFQRTALANRPMPNYHDIMTKLERDLYGNKKKKPFFYVAYMSSSTPRNIGRYATHQIPTQPSDVVRSSLPQRLFVSRLFILKSPTRSAVIVWVKRSLKMQCLLLFVLASKEK